MSTYMYAKTVLVHPSMASHTFENADALFGVKPERPEPHASLDLFSPGGTWVVNEVYGDSRHDYFTSAVAELCALSGINGLEFFQGKLKTPCRWKLPLGIEDGEDEVYGYACGYWLEGPELLTAHDALARLLDWSRANVDRIGRHVNDILWDYAGDMAGAIEDGRCMKTCRIKDSAWYAEDGEGAGYVFAYLGTACRLMNNAIASKHAVLHVAEILEVE